MAAIGAEILTTYFWYHLPKNGGSTIRHALQEELGAEAFLHLGAGRRNEGLPGWEELTHDERAEVRVVFGHDVFFDQTRGAVRESHELVVLREPASRTVSRYVYQMSRERPSEPQKFEDWLSEHPKSGSAQLNWLRRHILPNEGTLSDDNDVLDAVLERLQEFFFVGTTDGIDRWGGPVLNRVGLKESETPPARNVAGKAFKKAGAATVDEARAFLGKETPDDILYQFACERVEQFLTQ